MPKVYRDFFFHFDVFFVIMMLLGAIAYVVYSGLTFVLVGAFVLGLIIFSFSEYVTHRFIFHMKPPENAFMLKLIKRLHYDHHVHPNDLSLLFLPLWYSIPNLFVLAAVFYVFIQSFLITLSFSGGLMCMLLLYEWKHYIAHRPIKPKTKFGQWLKKTHILHHFKNENYWYGVSNPVFDKIFGTLKDEKEVETSKTARDLEKRKYKSTT
ncbi:sterol desaturase family protein [Priestia taiwanensis]|uniref:Fatty acid hydroxylase n=1 Tax=Priestia taiwanensis TaxID=1347902 RepID=A0A917AVA6_9BACI|nr:sterol desaturase family protein [Priestia taiwanensis]MBM7363529.1 sterol desaturase/sphingolipid hydroxylase (fatty acid hydroxylase superfamily) [Priestia taiwanensis]GGE76372.1 fatty acid hydroxylase [Priestia taiwanensis]